MTNTYEIRKITDILRIPASGRDAVHEGLFQLPASGRYVVNQGDYWMPIIRVDTGVIENWVVGH